MSTAVTWRRHLHVSPEPGVAEFRTASHVAGAMTDLGWSVVAGGGGDPRLLPTGGGDLGCAVEVERVGAVTTATGDPAAAEAVADAARGAGLEVVVPSAELGVASDDATAFMHAVQSRGGLATYLAFGSDLAGPHHTPGSDLDEAVPGPGVDLLERSVRPLPR